MKEIETIEELNEKLAGIITEEGSEELDEVLRRLEEFVGLIDSSKDKTVDTGAFRFGFEKSYDVYVKSVGGWKTVWPSGSEAWMILSRWILADDIESLGTFIKLVVFPTSVRISDIDRKYLDDIVMAHSSLSQRKTTENKTDN